MTKIKTPEEVDHPRRRFFGNAAMTIALAHVSVIGPASAQTANSTLTEAPAISPETTASFGPLKQIDVLNVGYAEAGPADGPAVILLHGWPYDIHTYVDVAPLLTSAGYRVIVPYLRGYGTTRFLSGDAVRNGQLEWWYQYYFATERGRTEYQQYTHEFAKLIWRLASPKWNFSDATFNRSAAALQNPDHVSIVIHNYRWRLGLAEGEPKYDQLEERLAAVPVISVPTITLEGDANGAPHPDPATYAKKFSGKYTHKLITGGIGHNLPQEAPRAFTDAIVEVDEK